jgi:hypothetical protein
MKWTVINVFLTMLFLLAYGFGLAHISIGQETDSEKRHPADIITEIRSLLNQTLIEYQNENFTGASDLAEKAYLENYEFIEGPLAAQNETLMEETEVMLRGQLRDQVTGEDPDADVQTLVEQINSNLDQAAILLANQTQNN